jgi:transcriptional regulator with AAA-type ATPase domain
MSSPRSTGSQLARRLNALTAPVWALDDDRRIVFANEACAKWTGVPAAALVGQVVHFDAPAEQGPPAVAAALCPPPDVFSGEPRVVRVECPKEAGTAAREVRFIPLGPPREPTLVLAVAADSDEESGDGPPPSDDAPEILRQRVQRYRQLMKGRYSLNELIGDSPGITRARAQAILAAKTDASVLILGPNGSIKGELARAIHLARPPQNVGRLLPIACPLMTGDVLRSTLFAFTSGLAKEEKVHTLLLEDVDRLPEEAQAELLRRLSQRPIPFRILATAAEVSQSADGDSTIRKDLACLLETLVIRLPPLARRPADVPLLVQAAVCGYNAKGGKQLAGMTPEAIDKLTLYPWPGDVAELREAVREACANAAGTSIGVADLPRRLIAASEAQAHLRPKETSVVLPEFLAKVELELIQRALRTVRGNKAKAARLLGMTRPRFYRRLVQLGLEKPAPSDEKANEQAG